MKAVNLPDETVMLFKNQKGGIITDIVDCSGPLNLSPEKDSLTVSYITNLEKLFASTISIPQNKVTAQIVYSCLFLFTMTILLQKLLF